MFVWNIRKLFQIFIFSVHFMLAADFNMLQNCIYLNQICVIPPKTPPILQLLHMFLVLIPVDTTGSYSQNRPTKSNPNSANYHVEIFLYGIIYKNGYTTFQQFNGVSISSEQKSPKSTGDLNNPVHAATHIHICGELVPTSTLTIPHRQISLFQPTYFGVVLFH